MSGFQRKELLRTPRSSHVSSRQSSRSSSRVSSRYHSDDEDDYMSNAYLGGQADALADTLDRLLLNEQMDPATPEAPAKDKFSEGIEILTTDRRNSSLEAREKALADIVSVISAKYEPDRISNQVASLLVKTYMTSRSETETILAVQALCICAAVDTALIHELVEGAILSKLLSSLGKQSTLSVTARANLAVGYSLLQFLLNYGGGGFKLEELTESLLELATDTSEVSAESSIASAAILGAGLITACHPSPNALIEEYLPWVIGFLTTSSTNVKLAAGKVIGMFYQLYDYPEDVSAGGDDGYEADDETGQASSSSQAIPDIDQKDLEDSLRQTIAESSKRIGKKEKRERKSLFRDVLKTVEQFSSAEGRAHVRPEDLLITHMKLSRSKSLSIDSWAKLILLQHYKWAYGQSIHTQIANNPIVKETLDELRYLEQRPESPQFVLSSADTESLGSAGSPAQYLAKSLMHDQEKQAYARDTERRQRQIRAKRQERLMEKGLIEGS